jgi:hypothetical protein
MRALLCWYEHHHGYEGWSSELEHMRATVHDCAHRQPRQDRAVISATSGQ